MINSDLHSKSQNLTRKTETTMFEMKLKVGNFLCRCWKAKKQMGPWGDLRMRTSRNHGWRGQVGVLAPWGLRVEAGPGLAWWWGPSCGGSAAADQRRVFPGEPARSLPRREGGRCSRMGQGRAGQARPWGRCVQDAGSWMSYSGVRHCAVDGWQEELILTSFFKKTTFHFVLSYSRLTTW